MAAGGATGEDNTQTAGWSTGFPRDVYCVPTSVEDLRTSAASFAPGTSCPDGLPARALLLLSDPMLTVLCQLGVMWEATAVWPTTESAGMTVMIPKVTSEGERPVTLFRTVIRVMAKAKSWRATGWLEVNSPGYLNMAQGRRVGDAMWRTQLRSLISQKCGMVAAEVMMDLHKAFDLVDRGLLLQAAAAGGYPLDVLAWGLAMYAFPRRLVFRGCVTPALLSLRGIAAGSAFATTELWLHLCASIGALVRRFPNVIFSVHVDDLGAAAEGDDDDEVAEELCEVVKFVRAELEDKCGLQVADPKTLVAATTEELASKVATAIGGAAESGLVVRKLGADYGLAVAPPGAAASAGRSVQQRRRRSSQQPGRPALGQRGWARARLPQSVRRKALKPKARKPLLPTRAGRVEKAGRRMSRLRHFRMGRKRLFAAAVLPAAAYGAEHAPWAAAEVAKLRGWAVEAHGVRAPGVPLQLAVLALDPCLDPAFLLPFAAVERWAREVWIATLPAGMRPEDAMSGEELYQVFRILTGTEHKPVSLGPGKALLEGFRALELEWVSPSVVAIDSGGPNLDLTVTAPALVKKLAKEKWTRSRRRIAEDELTARWRRMKDRGEQHLGDLIGGEPDLPFLLDELKPGKLPASAAKSLGAIAWGVLPTGDWLSRHGWQCMGMCPICNEPDDTVHVLFGCAAERPDAHRQAKEEWRHALQINN